jgi:heptosyltransferase-1
MNDPRFLLIRLGSLGDIIHALPSASALRDTFPGARIDWIVDRKWLRLLEGNPDISNVISLNRKSVGELVATVRNLRNAKYDCAIDFQALYKSAILSFASAAPRRIGFQSSYAREGLAALFYTDRLNPRGPHKIDHNLTLAQHAGAQASKLRFPLKVEPQDEEEVSQALQQHHIGEFFVLSPGGGWRSKCWPPERYGELHQKLVERFGWCGVVNFGPGEEDIAREVTHAAGKSPPSALSLGLGPLMSLLRRAKFVVSADTGPLHLGAALGVPVVGLFGPTDPSRNGPFSPEDIVVRNPRFSETTYSRGAGFAPSMLSITVQQAFDAVLRRLERTS